jgi:TolA-binding protein
MNPLWQSTVVIVTILTWLAAPPRSLAEASAREAFRRSTAPKTKVVLTNAGLPQSALVSGAVVTPPAAVPASDAASVKPTESAATEKHGEEWWRKRVTSAREQLRINQQSAEDLQTRINALQRDVVNRDNPQQAAKLREDLQKAITTLEATKKQIEADQKAIVGIQDEARRADVPAGWVR